MDVAEYLRTLVLSTADTASQLASREENIQAWEEFCAPIEGLPAQPGETFSRETIYDDHD